MACALTFAAALGATSASGLVTVFGARFVASAMGAIDALMALECHLSMGANAIAGSSIAHEPSRILLEKRGFFSYLQASKRGCSLTKTA